MSEQPPVLLQSGSHAFELKHRFDVCTRSVCNCRSVNAWRTFLSSAFSLAPFVKTELKHSCVSQNRCLAVNGAEVKVWTFCGMKDELEESLENEFKRINTPGPCKPLNVVQFKENYKDKAMPLAVSVPMSSSLLTSTRAKCRQIEEANILKRVGILITSQCAVMSQLELRQVSSAICWIFFLLLRTACP